jgi:hypothetical protein
MNVIERKCHSRESGDQMQLSVVPVGVAVKIAEDLSLVDLKGCFP